MAGTLVAQAPMWVATYIGIPFIDYGRSHEGCDCWGLARMIWNERAGIVLPEHAVDPDRGDLCEATMAANMGPWRRIEPGQETTLDGVMMLGCYGRGAAMKRAAMHVGVVIGGGWLIHTNAEVGGSCLMRYQESQHARKIAGFWRHESLCMT